MLYGIAVSGRRSVYLSLFLGLAALAVVLWVAGRRRRLIVGAALGVSGLFLASLLALGEDVPQQTGFFRLRVEQVLPRLRAVLGPESENPDPLNALFFQQRSGALHAFLDNPVLGIGYSGYYGSGYPGSIFELHSTPLRFLAETGMVGMTAYVAFIAALLGTSLRLARRAWTTPYRAFALIFAVAWWSLVVSYTYNRHVSERTFWLMLSLFLTFDAYLERWLFGRRCAAASRHAVPAVGPGPAPTGLQGSA